MDFEKIFALNKFFEDDIKTDIQKDIATLKNSFFALDLSFDKLLSNYLLVPLTESENDIETDKKSIKDSYESFFADFKRSSNLLVELYDKYNDSNDFKNLGLSATIEDRFQNAKELYDIVTTKVNEITNQNFKELAKHLNDAYYAYVFLLCGLNSIINAYNKKQPQTTLKQIENVPESPDIEVFSDTNISDFIKIFVASLPTLVVN